MNDQIARTLNTAACHAYFLMEGLPASVERQHLEIVAQATLAQLQTAADVVRAENAGPWFGNRQTGTGLRRVIHCTVNEDKLPEVQAFATRWLAEHPA